MGKSKTNPSNSGLNRLRILIYVLSALMFFEAVSIGFTRLSHESLIVYLTISLIFLASVSWLYDHPIATSGLCLAILIVLAFYPPFNTPDRNWVVISVSLSVAFLAVTYAIYQRFRV